MTGTVIRRMLAGTVPTALSPSDRRLTSLTGRESEVLAMLGQGLPNSDIARQLGIGVGTVKTQVGAILDKTGSSSRVQAALLAHQAGLAGSPARPAPEEERP